MNLLLDTHTFIWFINGEHLPEKTRNVIQDIENKCYFSIASLWEITIKTSLGKLSVKSNTREIAEFLHGNAIAILPITLDHLIQLQNLTLFHRDPFDRLIISQGIIEQLTIVTRDEMFSKYNVNTLWE